MSTHNFTIERGDLLADKLIVHPRMPGKSTAAEEFERVLRARRLANYKNPPRLKVLARAITFALHSSYSRARWA